MKNNLTYKGIIKGFYMPMLPENINKLYDNLFIRIIRVIGGLSLVLVLTSKYLLFPNFFHNPLLLLAIFQILQMFTISIIKIFYGIYMLTYKKKEFEVRNSPVSRYATHLSQIVYCLKIGCSVSAGTATFLGGGAVVDEILAASGRPRVFIPFMGSLTNKILGDPKIDTLNSMAEATKASATTESQQTVEELINAYNKLSPTEQTKFINDIKEKIEKQ